MECVSHTTVKKITVTGDQMALQLRSSTTVKENHKLGSMAWAVAFLIQLRRKSHKRLILKRRLFHQSTEVFLSLWNSIQGRLVRSGTSLLCHTSYTNAWHWLEVLIFTISHKMDDGSFHFRFRDSRDAEKSFKTRWTMAPSHFRFRDSRDAEKSFKTRWTMALFTFPPHVHVGQFDNRRCHNGN
ncbi:hypothetical protein AVEN_43978-1 [Araneus ventricosus]|uniref:Uncharacterized protein n=1 Tax=Araneus ventricosus TaxID=182803 RepID=A0A4Y2T5L0_ARAVE|nr:hypothetical protein AVEN_43978-1 [Araneus ventricosus]